MPAQLKRFKKCARHAVNFFKGDFFLAKHGATLCDVVTEWFGKTVWFPPFKVHNFRTALTMVIPIYVWPFGVSHKTRPSLLSACYVAAAKGENLSSALSWKRLLHNFHTVRSFNFFPILQNMTWMGWHCQETFTGTFKSLRWIWFGRRNMVMLLYAEILYGSISFWRGRGLLQIYERQQQQQVIKTKTRLVSFLFQIIETNGRALRHNAGKCNFP